MATHCMKYENLIEKVQVTKWNQKKKYLDQTDVKKKQTVNVSQIQDVFEI
jgi:hypothetical protein